MKSPQIVDIRWADSDLGDESKIYIKGIARLSDGRTITAEGMTQLDVAKQLNKQFISLVTGEFIKSPM